MAPVQKRGRPIPAASQRSKKRQKTDAPSQSKVSSTTKHILAPDEKFIPIAADALPWNEVELPEMHDDAEGFFGLEEIDDVRVIKDENNKVQFVSNKVKPILEDVDDGEEFEGFASDVEGEGTVKQPVVLNEKQIKAKEKRERKRREKKAIAKAEMEVKKTRREAIAAGLPVDSMPTKTKAKALIKTATTKKTKADTLSAEDVASRTAALTTAANVGTKFATVKATKPGGPATPTQKQAAIKEFENKIVEVLGSVPELGNDNIKDKNLAIEDEDSGKEDLQVNIFSALEEDTNVEEVDVSAWNDLDLSSDILSQLSRLGFSEPTNIQSESIPLILAGHDIIGKASTGSGKTLAFGIPIIQSWLEAREDKVEDIEDKAMKVPTALILSPTRELATQLADHILALCKGMGDNAPRIARVTGGLSVQKQQRQLALADIIVGTPGRLWDCLSASIELTKSFKSLKFLVIDEADRLLTEGHFKEVTSILSSLDRQVDAEDEDIVPSRQTLVFSATFNQGLQQKLAGKGKAGLADKDGSMEYLLKKLNFKDDKPKFVDTNSSSAMASGLKEGMIECGGTEKDLYLYALLLHHPLQKTLIFTNSIHSVRRLTPLLSALNLPALSLHSQMAQQARMRSIERFSSPTHPTSILVATDIAARGLDISGINLVIHYHLPRTADMYVHRSGRTARASATGSSILMCAPEEVAGMRRLIAKVHASYAIAGNMSINAAKKRYIRSLDVDRKVVARLKPRVVLAKKIADSGVAKEKKGHDDEWIRNAAEELGYDYDSEEFEAAGGQRKGKGTGRRKTEREAREMSKADVAALRAQLRELLNQRVNVGVSERYLTSGTVDIDELLKGVKGEFLGKVGGIGLE